MIQAMDLCDRFRQALNERWGYIMGEAGSLWTAAKQAAVTDDMAKRYGSKWIGHRVADCSGLFAWAFRQLGGSIAHGSNSIWKKYTTATGTLSSGRRMDGFALQPGTAVFKVRGTDYYHIGLFIGGKTVIEAQGTRTGVTTSDISKWHAWAELRGVQYKGEIPVQHEQTYTGPAMVYAENGKGVNVRTSPNGPKIGQLPCGTEVEIVEDNGSGWVKIQYSTTGWMNRDFLSDGRG